MWRKPSSSRASRHWTLSSELISALSVEELFSFAYSMCSRTILHDSGIKIDMDSSETNSNRRVVSTVSLQCTVEGKAVSRAAPGPLT